MFDFTGLVLVSLTPLAITLAGALAFAREWRPYVVVACVGAALTYVIPLALEAVGFKSMWALGIVTLVATGAPLGFLLAGLVEQPLAAGIRRHTARVPPGASRLLPTVVTLARDTEASRFHSYLRAAGALLGLAAALAAWWWIGLGAPFLLERYSSLLPTAGLLVLGVWASSAFVVAVLGGRTHAGGSSA